MVVTLFSIWSCTYHTAGAPEMLYLWKYGCPAYWLSVPFCVHGNLFALKDFQNKTVGNLSQVFHSIFVFDLCLPRVLDFSLTTFHHVSCFLPRCYPRPSPLHPCPFHFPTLHPYGPHSMPPSLFSSLGIPDSLSLLLWTYWTCFTVVYTYLGASGLSFWGFSLSSSRKLALVPLWPSLSPSLTSSYPGTHSVPNMFWTLYMSMEGVGDSFRQVWVQFEIWREWSTPVNQAFQLPPISSHPQKLIEMSAIMNPLCSWGTRGVELLHVEVWFVYRKCHRPPCSTALLSSILAYHPLS